MSTRIGAGPATGAAPQPPALRGSAREYCYFVAALLVMLIAVRLHGA